MRVLVVGAGGWLGRSFTATLHARRLPYTDVREAGRSAAAAGRLRDAIRADEGTVVVNVSGLKTGTPDQLHAANALIPATLASVLATSGAHLVQVGSAAEYGVPRTGRAFDEHMECLPVSDYGVSRLEGTEAVLATMPTATVLRPFNVVDSELPEGSPLLDVRERIERARSAAGPVELLAAGTIRDYISRGFAGRSIVAAARLRLPGVFNVCSGRGISTGGIARMVLDDLGMSNQINSTDGSLASRIVGNPDRWRGATGLSEDLGCRGVVDILVWTARTGR